jgi:glycosyltransferase involved in cell wall biosynthesis
MKIGLIIYGSLDTLSGGYLYDRKLVEYLRLQGDTVEIISLPPGMTDRSDWRNYAAHLADNFTFRLLPGLDILIQDELNHPSLVCANLGRHPYPVISLVHHLRCSELRPRWQNSFYRVVEKRYLCSVDGFIFNSQTTKGVVNELIGNGKPAIVAFPPTDRFGAGLPAALVAARAAESSPLRILFLGNVIPRKGLHTLLEAIRRQTLDVRLDVIGSLTADSVYAAEMQREASGLSPLSLVSFHGSKDNDVLAGKLRAAHVLAVPSSYEGFGIVYLEGMAFGLPAIGTTAGAAGEIIRDGETGYLIAPEDAEMLAARLAALASDRALLARMALNALKRYQQQPTWEQTAGEIREFLQKMIEIKSGK